MIAICLIGHFSLVGQQNQDGQVSERVNDSPPNILFIAVDDLNDWVGPLDGHPQTKTPNMDRLAAQGMVFSNAYAPGMICNTSRTAIMTGIAPSSSGVYENGNDWRLTKHLQDRLLYTSDAAYHMSCV